MSGIGGGKPGGFNSDGGRFAILHSGDIRSSSIATANFQSVIEKIDSLEDSIVDLILLGKQSEAVSVYSLGSEKYMDLDYRL